MKDKYLLTIGLEVHAELKTLTKMFCHSKNDTNELRPNVNICPVCLGYPGTLPVINKEAVRSVLRLGIAVKGKLADYTEFDRKHYFYPDIPKGYQISQYKHPLVSGGAINGIQLTRIHLEEDTARSMHISSGQSLVNLNRAGVPLMELVTEPVIHTKEEAQNFAKELQLLLQYLNISGANMEKGEMRVEVNISVSKNDTLGTKVEIKNINSFKAVEKAIQFESERQTGLIEKGEEVVQETRGWDDQKQVTFSQRLKESAHDYRYFPDPDLPKLFTKELPELAENKLTESLPELPWEKRKRLKKLGIADEQVEIYVRAPKWGRFLDETASILKDQNLIRLASNYITSDLKVLISVQSLVEVILMLSRGEISSRGAKDILKIIETEGGDPRRVAEEKNLIQKNNTEELEMIVKKIIENHSEAVTEYKNGKLASLQFLIGQAMKETKGSGNPQILKNILVNILR